MITLLPADTPDRTRRQIDRWQLEASDFAQKQQHIPKLSTKFDQIKNISSNSISLHIYYIWSKSEAMSLLSMPMSNNLVCCNSFLSISE